MAKITCDNISEVHEKRFLFIKGALGAKNNGEALEKIVDKVLPEIKDQVKNNKDL